MRPFFSVIVCTYNRADLLPRAFDSLIAQTEQDWEAIVVDDASTDGTGAVVQKYVQITPRFRLHNLDVQGGTATARNAGIELAQGLFVTFLDSDDAYKPEHLTTRKQMLLQNDYVQMIHGGAEVIGDKYVRDMYNKDEFIHIDDCVIGGTFVIRKDVFDSIGGFQPGAYADDALFYEKALNAGVVIAKTDEKTYLYYRDRTDQQTK